MPGKKIIVILIFILCLIATGCKEESSVVTLEEETTQEPETQEITQLYVHVCGEVIAPGVYELPQGSRYFDAVEMAGGMTESAQASSVNLAMPIEDGMKIYIPSKDEPISQEQADGVNEDGLVSINKATQEELVSLPGIGLAKAQDIITFREENNGFSNLEDVMQVPGIKEGTYNKIKDKIKL